MDSNSLLKQATASVAEAIKADNDQNYTKAYDLYKRSLEQFMVALKYEKNPKSRDILMNRVKGYMSRAEELKKVIDSDAEAERERSKGGGKKATAAGGGENKKLKGALASAILTDKPNVKWDDVAGLDVAKDALKEAVILPARFPQLFTGKRRPWEGILLYGPPGTGKSFLAKAIATEADSMFFSVSSSDLVSKWQGESERLVRSLFEMAREKKPSIIFIDEIDSLCGSREDGGNDSARRIKTEFLVQMEGVGKQHGGVLVLGATNTPWTLDPAMRRRFQKRIYIPLPDPIARTRMFELNVGDTPSDLDEDDFEELGHVSEGFSGSDIAIVVREALMEPLRMCQQAKFFREDEDGMMLPLIDDPPCTKCPKRLSSLSRSKKFKKCKNCDAIRMGLLDLEPELLKVPDVTKDDFLAALENTTSSVSPDELIQFQDWTEEFGQEG